MVGLVAGWLAGVLVTGSGFGAAAGARLNTGLGAREAEAMSAVIGAPVLFVFAGRLIAAGRRR